MPNERRPVRLRDPGRDGKPVDVDVGDVVLYFVGQSKRLGRVIAMARPPDRTLTVQRLAYLPT